MKKIGDTLLEEEPYCHVLSESQRGTRCDRCFLKSETLKKCTACGYLQYCDRMCQKRDWTIHKKECKCLKKVSPKIPVDSVRLMLRLVLAKSQGLPMNSVWSRKLDDFMTHKTDIDKDTDRVEQFAKMAYTLKVYAGDVIELPSATDMLFMFCKMVINSFSICDGTLRDIGTGIYLSGSMLDHSCKPNAVATFHGSTLVVKATDNIPDTAPNKIFISYVELLSPATERQAQLKGQYYFDCKCEKCEDLEQDELMTSFYCPRPNCGGPVCVTREGKFKSCRKCKASDFSDVLKKGALKVHQDCKAKLQEIDEAKKEDDPKKVYKLCRQALKDIHKILHPMNITMVRVLDRAMDAALDMEEFEKALDYGLRTLEPYKTYYPDYSPNYAIQLFKMGKLQLYLQELGKALRSLQQAETILTVTHGTGHPIYKEITLFTNQCAEELRVRMENNAV